MKKLSSLAQSRTHKSPDFSFATVNIVLLLVLFFLVVGAIGDKKEFSVELAETTDLPLDRLPRPLLLILPDNEWYLDGEAITAPALLARIQQQAEAQPDGVPVMHILAARNLPADDLVQASQLLSGQNLSVLLVTQHTKAEAVQ